MSEKSKSQLPDDHHPQDVKTDRDKSSSIAKTQQNSHDTNALHSSLEYLEEHPSVIKVSDIIGDFGPYQIAVVIFASLRAMSCAMDSLSGPFLSPSIKNFQCDCDITSQSILDFQSVANYSAEGVCNLYSSNPAHTRYELDSSQCYFKSSDSLHKDKINCNKWFFNNTDNVNFMNSLTVEQSLVCDQEWLKSLSNSMYFVGATMGLLFWGVISDKYGRKTAYVCSHLVTLTFGLTALFAETMSTYIILRAINAFGMIGELIPRSLQVEIVAAQYRSLCSIICQIGWATGIILVPTLSYWNPSYKFILSFPVFLSALMLPWLYWLPESARWLITRQEKSRARKELIRAAKTNGKLTDDIDSKIEQYSRQVLREETFSSPGRRRIGVWGSIIAIFTNMHLLKDTISVFVLLFFAEVVYFSLTLNVADLGGSLYTNYIISGFSELVSIGICAFLLANLSRRMCLSLLLLASTVSYLMMVFTKIYEESMATIVILSVNAFGKLTAIGNLMVIILVSQELFPTVVRQIGTSLCITVGKAGSAVAPFTHELGQTIGQSYCFSMFSLICLGCALIPFGLSETGKRELPDTVIDVEEGISKSKRKSLKRPKLDQKSGSFVAHYESNGSMPRTLGEKEMIEGSHHPTVQNLTFSIQKKPSSVDDLNNNNLDSKEMVPSSVNNKIGSNQKLTIYRAFNDSMSNLSVNTGGITSNAGSSSDISHVDHKNA